MSEPAKAPASLMEAVQYFSDPLTCVQFFAALRWEDGQAVCSRCTSKHVSFLSTRLMWKCLDCKKQFSIKVGTIFEDSPIGLDKWLWAMFLIANCKNGVSSYEIARDLHVTQRTAWFMLQRIRHAMHTGTFNKLSGQVEAGETFIGGKARNMCVFRAMPITVPRRWRSRFRTDADHDSEMMAIAIPTGSRSLFGGSRNGDRHRRNHFLKLSS